MVNEVIGRLEAMEENEQLAWNLATHLRTLVKVSSKLSQENCSTLEAAMDQKSWTGCPKANRGGRSRQGSAKRSGIATLSSFPREEVLGIVLTATFANSAEKDEKTHALLEEIIKRDLLKDDQISLYGDHQTRPAKRRSVFT